MLRESEKSCCRLPNNELARSRWLPSPPARSQWRLPQSHRSDIRAGPLSPCVWWGRGGLLPGNRFLRDLFSADPAQDSGDGVPPASLSSTFRTTSWARSSFSLYLRMHLRAVLLAAEPQLRDSPHAFHQSLKRWRGGSKIPFLCPRSPFPG